MKQKTNSNPHADATQWYAEAMQRDSAIDAAEISRRRDIATAHNRQHQIDDAEILADQELYIQGKMPLNEYQQYLQFKHSNP